MDSTRQAETARPTRDIADALRDIALECDKVTKIFKPPRGTTAPVIALHETSFTVRDGEFICLLGPSGCGKSTVINMVAGFEAPTAGRITLDGREIDAGGGLLVEGRDRAAIQARAPRHVRDAKLLSAHKGG